MKATVGNRFPNCFFSWYSGLIQTLITASRNPSASVLLKTVRLFRGT